MTITEIERIRWREFKANIKPDVDISEKERIILEMSKKGASAREIKNSISCGLGDIGRVRLSARRRGMF